MSNKGAGITISEVEEHISLKYEIKRRLGKGAYGIVWKAVDRQTGEVVAVKKIFDAFRNRTDAQRTFREIMFLQEFGDHANIIKLINVIRAQNDKDIYLIFEHMDTDLHAVIKKGSLLKDVHKRYVMYQLLKATKYLHSGNVIHRDQKPSNILLDTDCSVKLCDFGLARSLCQIQEDAGNPTLTEYVATRWYRAPEILLGSSRYTKGIDMWSIGCILGEMLLGKALFPGTSSINQIEKILSAIAHPSPEDIQSIKSEYGASVIQRMLLKPQVPLEEILQPAVPPDALDLVQRLLVFNPDKRLTAGQALQHPYVARFHNPLKEPALGYSVVLSVGDDTQLSVVQYRNKLYEMILERRTTRWLPKPTQPKQIETTSSGTAEAGAGSALGATVGAGVKANPTETNPAAEEKGEKEPVAIDGEGHSDPEEKSLDGNGDGASDVPAGSEVPKPRAPHVALQQTAPQASPTSAQETRQLTYNPITHAPNGFVKSPGGPPHFYRSPGTTSRTPSHQPGTDNAASSESPNAITMSELNLQQGGPAAAAHTRSFSLALTQAQNNPLVRREEPPTAHSGLCVTTARLNQRSQAREARPAHRFSKKVFQTTSNVSGAGDPRAKLGSYSQAYGTINKTQLDNLLQSRP
ncbi:mitogen-activated protein kinase 15 [Gadus chalcogrammus]|uniref:mitogen-activated protein kinase 15 n=1 Tax=Gadus chalcogrammus TaxID=1042646 RepID=UPI0024C4CE18|nr:mitogen-activated protein kinase 15 [Gadus chalcogrammus]